MTQGNDTADAPNLCKLYPPKCRDNRYINVPYKCLYDPSLALLHRHISESSWYSINHKLLVNTFFYYSYYFRNLMLGKYLLIFLFKQRWWVIGGAVAFQLQDSGSVYVNSLLSEKENIARTPVGAPAPTSKDTTSEKRVESPKPE